MNIMQCRQDECRVQIFFLSRVNGRIKWQGQNELYLLRFPSKIPEKKHGRKYAFSREGDSREFFCNTVYF